MVTPPELFDLHTHSTRSDGLRSVMELAHLASLSGLAGLAITDHDILPDSDMLSEAGHKRGVLLLSGIELSTVWRGKRLHLLGYGFSAGKDSSLHGHCQELVPPAKRGGINSSLACVLGRSTWTRRLSRA